MDEKENTNYSTTVKLSEYPNSIPGDINILRPWFNVVRDARAAGVSNGLSIVSICVLVDEHGMPIQWCKAEPTRLSPRSGREQFELLVKAMAGDKQIAGEAEKEIKDARSTRGKSAKAEGG